MKRTTLIAIACILMGGCQVQPKKTTSETDWLEKGFIAPTREYRPETWFHINGNNLTREGLTKDLEAIHYAGIRGIQLFNKDGDEYPGVPQVEILSPQWRELIGHVADECERLGLDFTMQNCPGWSQAGGPWVPVEEAQRELVQSVTRVEGGADFQDKLKVDSEYLGPDYDYQDICVLAFPTPQDDAQEAHVPVSIESNNQDVPWNMLFDPKRSLRLNGKAYRPVISANPQYTIEKVNGEDTWVRIRFPQPVTIRSLHLPPIRTMVVDQEYPEVDLALLLEAIDADKLTKIAEIPIPNSCWQDDRYGTTLALPEVSTQEVKITFTGAHKLYLAHLFVQGQARLHNWEGKAAIAMRSLESGYAPDYSPGCYLDPEQIVDLSQLMDESGILTWSVPKGSWTLVRFGHVNMREENGPAVPEATGWECSKLDKVALENHIYKGMIGDLTGPEGTIGEGKLDGLLIDSWERRIPTWTMKSETLFEEFKERRAYEMRPFLPAMMGYIIKDPSHTELFLRDLRETMDDLFVENFFAHFRTIARDFGARVYTEGATGEVLPGDAMRYYGVSDVPMTEFWYPRAPSAQVNGKPVKAAASASHLYNKQLVAAEACTEVGVRWDEHPFTVKYLIDHNFTLGVNHLVFHTFSHTPQEEVYPGSSFGSFVGFPLVRNQTWWRHTPAWTDYLARCQYMLQQGEYVADVLWYLGDELERPPFQDAPFPEGYQYDLLNTELLHNRLSVHNGMIKVDEGGEYRLIILRDSKRMLRSTAERIRELVLKGAVILGERPEKSPSLMDGPGDLKMLEEIAEELWGEGDAGVKKVGKGKVYWGKSLSEVLQEESISKDVTVPEELDLPWIHRQTEAADIYFLSNQSEYAVDASIAFRIRDRIPELWNPQNGEMKEAGVFQNTDGMSHVALSFEPNGSVFVVFRKSKEAPSWIKVEQGKQTLLDCSPGWYRMYQTELPSSSIRVEPESFTARNAGVYTFTGSEGEKISASFESKNHTPDHSWRVSFEAGWDTPDSIDLPELIPLSQHPNRAVRYYSGTTTYKNQLNLPEISDSLMLDLGKVGNIAEVWCNGTRVGTRWAPPFTFDLTGFATEGMNDLEVRVTNTWRNQLIYDLQRPENEKLTWTTNPPNNPDEAPAPSGLIGPVVLIEQSTTQIR